MIKFSSIKKKYIILFIITLLFIVSISFFIIEYNETNVGNIYKIKENNDKNINKIESSQLDLKPVSYNAVIPIYMYHWVREDTGGYEYPEMMVKTSEIKKQFEYLSKNSYQPIFITDIKDIYKYNKPIALTFDDGWIDVYTNVFPYVKEYNIKISMYIIKNLVGTSGYCNEEQLKEMRDSGLVDIQSHTVTHRELESLSDEEIYNELKISKDYLKDVFNINSTVICYPSGSFNDKVIDIAKKVGYNYGLAMDGGIHYTSKMSDMQIARIFATRSMSLNTFVSYAEKSNVNVKWE